MGKAREAWSKIVAEAHTDWRLFCLPPRRNDAAVMVFREGMSDIIRLRLRIAYMPLFQALERIEKRCGILADLRREPWAHSQHPVNRNEP